MKKIKLSTWAKENCVCYKTAWNYFKAGKFKDYSEQTPEGSIFIFEQKVKNNFNESDRSLIENLITLILSHSNAKDIDSKYSKINEILNEK